jgi:hypothetical protein
MDALLNALRADLDRSGLHAGLAFLNQRVAHRFTGVYRLRGGVLHNIGLFDKQGEVASEALLAVPLTDSFCQFVLRDGLFAAGNTATDPMLDGHPYQGVVGSYVGLPLTRTGDDLQGTLCHFDFATQDVPDDELAFLRRAALLLPRYLQGC